MNNYSVYMHVDPDGKLYIGLTSQPPLRRWNKGKGYRRKHKGKFGQPLMAKAVGRIPWEYWEHWVLYDNLSKDEAENLEAWLIYLSQSDDPRFGYNVMKGTERKGGSVWRTGATE